MRNFIASIAFASAVLPAVCAPQGQAPAGNLAQQIQGAYPVTVMQGMKVTQPGTILVVKKEGLQANPMDSKLKAFYNDYEDGQVTTGARSSAIGAVTDKLPSIPGPFKKKAKLEARALAVDEKVYLLKVEVQPTAVVFLIQTCGTCDPAAADPAHHPYQASVSMHFVKGFQTATDLKHVQQAVSDILAAPEDNAGDQNAQAQPQQQEAAPAAQPAQPAPAAPAAAPAQQFDSIAPPAPPPADPVQIGLGQTVEQVTAALGQPGKVLKAGTKEIYVYKDLKVTFVKGKVTDVE